MLNRSVYSSGRNHERQWSTNPRVWQLAVLLAVWVYLWTLQLDNDGLWYRGDASRHALNGLFWADYLRDFTLDAKGYALSYYARYPAIDPASRPPFFICSKGPRLRSWDLHRTSPKV